ncbi:hypothetical protein TNCV_3453831 [Trichonephila clavipes]|nr:hypothetical protein TNCV_3453831 [Trichonephila clavipes]
MNVPKCRSVCHALSGVPKEKIRSSTTTWTFSSHPPAIAPFHRIELISLGDFQTEVDEIAKFLLEEIVPQAWSSSRVIITDRGAVFRSRLVSSLVD